MTTSISAKVTASLALLISIAACLAAIALFMVDAQLRAEARLDNAITGTVWSASTPSSSRS